MTNKTTTPPRKMQVSIGFSRLQLTWLRQEAKRRDIWIGEVVRELVDAAIKQEK